MSDLQTDTGAVLETLGGAIDRRRTVPRTCQVWRSPQTCTRTTFSSSERARMRHHRNLIVALAARHRLPAVHPCSSHVMSGGSKSTHHKIAANRELGTGGGVGNCSTGSVRRNLHAKISHSLSRSSRTRIGEHRARLGVHSKPIAPDRRLATAQRHDRGEKEEVEKATGMEPGTEGWLGAL
jgi:hypothetical protein